MRKETEVWLEEILGLKIKDLEDRGWSWGFREKMTSGEKRTPGHISVFLNGEDSEFIFWIIKDFHLALCLKAHEDALQEISEGKKWGFTIAVSWGAHNSWIQRHQRYNWGPENALVWEQSSLTVPLGKVTHVTYPNA